MVRGDTGGDLASVERVVRGLKASRPVSERLALGMDHRLDGVGKVELAEDLADRRRPTVWQEDRCIGRPARVAVLIVGDEVREERIDGKALARAAYGGGGCVGEAHRPEAAQRLDPGGGRGRDHGAQQSLWYGAAEALREELCGRGAGPRAEPVYGQRLALHGLYDDRRDAGEVDEVAMHDG